MFEVGDVHNKTWDFRAFPRQKICPDEKNQFFLGIQKSCTKKVVLLYQKGILIQIKCDLICNYINRPCITS